MTRSGQNDARRLPVNASPWGTVNVAGQCRRTGVATRKRARLVSLWRQWSHLGEERPALPTDVFSQIFPDLVGHFEEHPDDQGIELATRPELDFLTGGLECLRRTIGAVHGHSVEGVGDREYARAERDLLSLQAAGIT